MGTKFLRYIDDIDDIFMIWTDGEDSLNDFLAHCNNQNKHIQSEQTISSTSIPFLDVSVTLEHSTLITDLYTKSTDKHQYLHRTSCHPKHTRTSLPYCLALGVCRICSSENLFHQRTTEMKKHLIQRGYKQKTIHSAIKKASLVTREEALADKITPKSLQRFLSSLLIPCYPTYTRFYMIHSQFSMPLRDPPKFSEASVICFAANALHLLNPPIHIQSQFTKPIVEIIQPTQTTV